MFRTALDFCSFIFHHICMSLIYIHKLICQVLHLLTCVTSYPLISFFYLTSAISISNIVGVILTSVASYSMFYAFWWSNLADKKWICLGDSHVDQPRLKQITHWLVNSKFIETSPRDYWNTTSVSKFINSLICNQLSITSGNFMRSVKSTCKIIQYINHRLKNESPQRQLQYFSISCCHRSSNRWWTGEMNKFCVFWGSEDNQQSKSSSFWNIPIHT